jgi:rhodanese-related sulfurtransferase
LALRQSVYILVIASVLGLGFNLVSPNRIDFVGEWRELHEGTGPIVPPSAMEGDAPFIAVDSALIAFNSKSAVFVDAREPEEFECGTIPGAINIPFDYLPEGDLGPHFDSALSYLPMDERIIVFCSGEECDASLHLARNMQPLGYTNLAIFFGGSREWEKFELPVERRRQCED